MGKKTSFLLLAGLIISILGGFLSCRLSKDLKNPVQGEKNISLDEKAQKTFSFANENERVEKSVRVKNGETAGASLSETLPKTQTITHYDSIALDDKVREYAQRLGVDPKTYRLPVREDPDQTKIYRMLGMHVIVNPNGEEVFIPDEL